MKATYGNLLLIAAAPLLERLLSPVRYLYLDGSDVVIQVGSTVTAEGSGACQRDVGGRPLPLQARKRRGGRRSSVVRQSRSSDPIAFDGGDPHVPTVAHHLLATKPALSGNLENADVWILKAIELDEGPRAVGRLERAQAIAPGTVGEVESFLSAACAAVGGAVSPTPRNHPPLVPSPDP